MTDLYRLDLVGIVWRKSSHSDSYGACVAVARVRLRSSHSGTAGNCVEAAAADPAIAVRDSKDPAGATLAFGGRAWRRFTTDIKWGSYTI